MLISARVCLSIVMRMPLCKHNGLSIVHDQERIGGALPEHPPRRIEALVRQLECAVMDRDAGLSAQDMMGSRRVVRSHVHRRHEPAGLVCPDRQQRHARRAKPLADEREMIPESRVAREINFPANCFDQVAAPQSPIAIQNRAC